MTASAHLRRSEGYFGLHTDFHASALDQDVWGDLTEEMVERVLRDLSPDFVQVDCKGHTGYASYPTKVGFPAPGLKKDGLRIWRDVTRRHGVALVVHYSALWDAAAIELHPEWAVIRADGSQDDMAVSFFSPYLDELMIPQLKEVILMYDVDAAWVDADSWGTAVDYSEPAVTAFHKATGIAEPPRSTEDPNWETFFQFFCDQFRLHATKYMEALHAFRPGFQVTSNWVQSPGTPGLRDVPVDYLSGDYMPEDAADAARLTSRYWNGADLPWDLMAWTHTKGDQQFNRSIKPVVQLQQEAAATLAQGGSWQCIIMGTRSGYIDESSTRMGRDVASFVRERKALCRHGESIPQVGLILPEEAMQKRLAREGIPYRFHECVRPPLVGLLRLLLHAHYSVDVRSERDAVDGRLQEFPMLAVPECESLPGDVVESLKAYAASGGSLLLGGPRVAALFEAELGVRFEGSPVDMRDTYRELEAQDGGRALFFLHPEFPELHVETDGVIADCGGVYQHVRPETAEVMSRWYPQKDTRDPGHCAASVTSCGSGSTGAFYVPLPEVYYQGQHPLLHQAFQKTAHRLFAEPMVEVDGSKYVDVSLKKKGDQIIVHLVNTFGMDLAPRQSATDEIPPIHNLVIRLRVESEPRHVECAYGGRLITEAYQDGVLSITLDQLAIHDALVVRV